MKRLSESAFCARLTAAGRRWLPWFLLALAVAPAAWPYAGAGLPRTNDAPLHLYRALALDRLIRGGCLWPRWSPDLVHGYGYPVFNFFSPLAHYTVALPHLAGLSLTTAYRLAVFGQFILAAWTAYLLGRDCFGPTGGWVAALAYVYSPYLLYDAHVRGGLAESLALALLPLLFFTLRRAALSGGRWLVGGAAVFGTLTLIHAPSTVQLMLPLGFWLLWLGWETGWRTLWRPLLALAAGGLLVSVFWMPLLAEARYVQSDLAIARGYHFESNFLALRELLAFPRLPADSQLFNPPVVRSLPQMTLALALLSWLGRWRRTGGAARRAAGVWAGLGALCTALILPQAIPVWRLIPMLALTQFPWRLLGFVSLAGALCLAASFAGIEKEKRRTATLWSGVVVVCLSVAAVPWLYPPHEPFPEAPALADMLAFEYPPVFIGTTTLGEFLPVWVEEMPDTTALRQKLAADGWADRLVVPPDVTVEPLRLDPLAARYRLRVTAPATLHYQQFYFPGWTVTLDRQPVALRASVPHGLIEFDAPPGTFTLDVTFGATPIRRIGTLFSGLTALGLAVFCAFARRPRLLSAPAPSERTSASWAALLVILTLGVHGGFALVETPLRRSALGPAGWRGPGEPLMLDVAGELRLLAYEQSASQLGADERLAVALYWQAQHPLGVVYDFSIDLEDERGLRWSAPGFERPVGWRWLPGTDTWPVDVYMMDTRDLRFVEGAPPGEYLVRLGVVRRDTQQTVAVHTLGRLAVTRPLRDAPPSLEGLQPATVATGERWQLLGSAIDRQAAAPGDAVRITLLARAGEPPALDGDGALRLDLVSASGETLFSAVHSVADTYPAERWQPGDLLRTEALQRLPAWTPAGRYTWQVRFAEGPSAPVGALDVLELERLWETPAPAWPVNARLGDCCVLVGADLLPADLSLQPGQRLDVTLTWQALAETETSYRVFVHLLDPAGRLVTQSDAVPAGWTRPTTGWLPGEFVLDPHLLTIPPDASPGLYRLLAGLYTPDGGRLTTPEGDDAVLLGELWILDF